MSIVHSPQCCQNITACNPRPLRTVLLSTFSHALNDIVHFVVHIPPKHKKCREESKCLKAPCPLFVETFKYSWSSPLCPISFTKSRDLQNRSCCSPRCTPRQKKQLFFTSLPVQNHTDSKSRCNLFLYILSTLIKLPSVLCSPKNFRDYIQKFYRQLLSVLPQNSTASTFQYFLKSFLKFSLWLFWIYLLAEML